MRSPSTSSTTSSLVVIDSPLMRKRNGVRRACWLLALVGERLQDARPQVGLVDTCQGERTRHGADLSLQDPEQQMRRLRSFLAGNGCEASFKRALGRCPQFRTLGGVARPWEGKGGKRHSDRAQAVLELPVQRVADRSMIQPDRGQNLR